MPALRESSRQRRIALNVANMAVLACCLGYFLALNLNQRDDLVVAMMLASWCAVPGLVAVGMIVAMLEHRLRRRVERSAYCMCASCGYSLSGLPRHSRCPECGVAHDLLRLEEFWRRTVRSSQEDRPRRTFVTRQGGLFLFAWIGAVMGVYMLIWALERNMDTPLLGPVVLPLTLSLASFIGAPLAHRWVERLRKRLIHARFCLCRRCGTDLNRALSSGSCPKCKERYERRELQALWRAEWPPNWQRDVVIPAQRAERKLSAYG